MSFDAALVKEQGVNFAVVAVKNHVMQSQAAKTDALAWAQGQFPGVPIVLVAQDGRGVPTYWGRRDIVNFLAHVPAQALPWRHFS